MRQINNNIYELLFFGILIIFTSLILLGFYRAIKSQTNNKLILFTNLVLASSIMITLLQYQFDLTWVLPLKPEIISYGLKGSIINLVLFAILLVLTTTRYSNIFVIATWVIILFFNALALYFITLNYLTWTPEPLNKDSKTHEIIFGNVMEYPFSRYLFNVIYPALWTVLSCIALNKLRKKSLATDVNKTTT